MDEVAEGKVRRWSAVNLTSAKSGLAAWKVEDLAGYLKNGASDMAGTFGPMNDVIVNSLSKLPAEDLHAMAVYLKALPAQEHDAQPVSGADVQAGADIYLKRCDECHGSSGSGGLFAGPPLAGSAVALAADPASLINVILYAPKQAEGIEYGNWETMKPYADVLSDAEIAAVANYIRGSWGNKAPPVRATDAAAQR